MKKIKIMILALSMIIAIQFLSPVYANETIDETTTEIKNSLLDEKAEIPWDLVWGIIDKFSQELWKVEGTVENTTEWTYRVSPTFWFNGYDDQSGNTYGPLAAHRLDIYAPGQFLLHGHKSSVIPTGKIAISLFDPNVNLLKSQTCTSNQYMDYTIPTNSFGPYGKYLAQYVNTENQKWQVYARYIFDPNFEWRSKEIDGFYYTPEGKVFQYSDQNTITPKYSFNKDASLTATELNNQFINPADGVFVDYLKDYDPGDTLYFEDKIAKVEFIPDESATLISFQKDKDENIDFYFAGDLSGIYKENDVIKLKFNILKSGQSENYIFENIDYTLDVEKTDNYPEISDYLV